MEKYVLPQDLAFHFETSLKTVYNYLKKWKREIEVVKRDWKRWVNFEAFQTFYNSGSEPYNPNYKESSNIQENKDSSPIFDKVQNLQSTLQETQEKVNTLSKYNSNLQDQVSKYALLLTEEKNEKKEMFTKLTNLQDEVNQKVETYANEKVFRTKRYYIILGICIVLCIVSILVVLPWLLDFLFSWANR